MRRMMDGRLIALIACAAASFLPGRLTAQESFEGSPAGAWTKLPTVYGLMHAEEGHARLIEEGRSGNQSLHIEGGENKTISLVLDEAPQEKADLSFWLRKSSDDPPFSLQIEALDESRRTLADSSVEKAKSGDFATEVKALLPPGTAVVRLTCTSAKEGGVDIDDWSITGGTPMQVSQPEAKDPGVFPVMKGRSYNPVSGICIPVSGSLDGKRLRQVVVRFSGAPADVEAVSLHIGSADPANRDNRRSSFGSPLRPSQDKQDLTFTGDFPLRAGDNWLWISVTPSAQADIRHKIGCTPRSVAIDGKSFTFPEGSSRAQRIGSAVCTSGDMRVKRFRLPGVIRTKSGTLVACFDARYNHGGNLPANIDVAFSRSTDGGQSWSAPAVAMDMGSNPETGYDGCGDSCILQDARTGRIWIAALWAHGNWGQAFNGSRPGMSPDETGQWVMVSSDDDGLTWSPDVTNITPQIKPPDWRLVLPGPGMGICTSDGVLVFPAQFRSGDDDQGRPYSTICFSKDGGRTWSYGKGLRPDTTECQVVELKDGSLMLNCKDNRGSYRTVGVTRDLGKTWSFHATDRKTLVDPICQASLIAVDRTPKGRRLYFSNPDTPGGRYNMSVRASRDEGKSWEAPVTFDYRSVPGHSCLTPIDDTHLGIIYESDEGINFLAIPYSDLEPASNANKRK